MTYTKGKWRNVRLFSILGGIVALTLFILACGDDATPTPGAGPGGATATPTVTATPATRELVAARLVVSMPAPAGQITAHYQSFQSAGGPLHAMYDYLVGLDPVTSEESPGFGLATEWSVDAAGRNWTFKLREDVPYYLDGKASSKYSEFTAKDVRHTWEIMAGKKNDSEQAGDWDVIVNGAEDWEIVNDHEFILHHKVIELEIPFRLSEEWTFGITSLDYWNDLGGDEEAFEAKPIGTGSFTFVEAVVNQHFLFEKVEDHWRKTSEFEEVQFLWTKEAATRVAQLIAGEVAIADLPRVLQEQILSAGMVIAKSTVPSFHMWIRVPFYQEFTFDGRKTPNWDPNEPLRDNRVRLAMQEAIDRNTINETFFKGAGIPEPVTYFPPWREDFKDEWAPFPGPDGETGAAGGWPYAFDPDHARQLLADAGFPDGFDLVFMASINSGGVPELPDVGEAIAVMWENIGINVEFQALDNAEIRARQNDHAWSGSVNLTRYSLDPISLAVSFGWFEHPARGFFEQQFITDWKNKMDTTIDADERLRLAQELGDFWRDQNVSIPLLWLFAEAGVNPNIVAEYRSNHLHFGPVRYHEYTKAVFK